MEEEKEEKEKVVEAGEKERVEFWPIPFTWAAPSEKLFDICNSSPSGG